MPDPIGGKEAMRQSTRALIGAVICACCAQQLSAAESGKSWWPFGKKDEAKAAQPTSAGTPDATQQTNLPAIASAPATAAAANPLAVAPPAANAPIVPQRAATAGSIAHNTVPQAAVTPNTAAPGAADATTPIPHEASLPTTAETEKKESWMLSSKKGKVSWPHLNKDLSKGGPLFKSDKKEQEADPTRNSWAEKTPAPPKPSPMKPVTDGAHKFSAGTKSVWNKTVNALTPGDEKDKAKGKAPTAPRIAKREVQPPLWKRMFGAKSELQQPQTVPEWMAQQRLDP
jgi:hypothetical protein